MSPDRIVERSPALAALSMIRDGWLPGVVASLFAWELTHFFTALLAVFGILLAVDYLTRPPERKRRASDSRNDLSSMGIAVAVAVAVHMVAHLDNFYRVGSVPDSLGVGLLVAYIGAELVRLNRRHVELKGFPIPGAGPPLLWVELLQARLIPSPPAVTPGPAATAPARTPPASPDTDGPR